MEVLLAGALRCVWGPCTPWGGVAAAGNSVLLRNVGVVFFFSFSLSHPLFGSHWKLLPRERGSLKKAIGTLLIEHEGCSVPAMSQGTCWPCTMQHSNTRHWGLCDLHKGLSELPTCLLSTTYVIL